MVVAVATMQKETALSSELTKKKVIELIRKDIESNGRTLQEAAVKVCADLVDQGLKDDLFDLFVCDGMEDSYRKSLSTWRRGHAEPELVEAKPEQIVEVEPDPVVPVTPPTMPTVTEPALNVPYDPTKARGIGDRIIQELPVLTGRLAAPYWVSEGRQKPLGYLSRDELDTSIARTETMAGSYQHSLRFQKRVRDGMGKDHQFVYQAFPDPSIVDTLYELSSGPAKP